jgi:Uma2 family endonuclease
MVDRPEAEEDSVWQDDPRRHAAAVRAIYDEITPPAGWRVEIIGGQIVVSAAPVPAHGYIVEIIRTAVAASLAPEYGAYENIEFEEPEADCYVPDLAVWLRKSLRGSVVRPRPEVCKLVVEVSLPGLSARDYTKAGRYARCGIPVYLLVDQSKGMCLVFSEPEGNRYRNVRQVAYGVPVTLPLDPPVTIETADF